MDGGRRGKEDGVIERWEAVDGRRRNDDVREGRKAG
jgi:hypothetical protein